MRLGQEWARLQETSGQLMRRTAHIAGADAQREVARESPAIGLWAWRCLAQGKKARPALEAERAGLCGLRRLCRNAAEIWNSASDSPSCSPSLRPTGVSPYDASPLSISRPLRFSHVFRVFTCLSFFFEPRRKRALQRSRRPLASRGSARSFFFLVRVSLPRPEHPRLKTGEHEGKPG